VRNEGGNSEPLASAVIEYRWYGIGSMAFGLVAIAVEPPLRALFLFTFFGVFSGSLCISSSSGAWRAGPSPNRLGSATVSVRPARQPCGEPLVSSSCKGGALLATSRWFRHWEAENSAYLFRSPHYRWRRDRPDGRRGRGIMDPRDFFAVTRS